jgi:hypothetical protein
MKNEPVNKYHWIPRAVISMVKPTAPSPYHLINVMRYPKPMNLKK